jgi:hypothetical protein
MSGFQCQALMNASRSTRDRRTTVTQHTYLFFQKLRVKKVFLIPLYRAVRDAPGAGAVSPEIGGYAGFSGFGPALAARRSRPASKPDRHPSKRRWPQGWRDHVRERK